MSRANSTNRAEARHAGSAGLPLEPNVDEPAPGLAALHELVFHGHRVFYRSAGSGPVVVLVHGITSTSATWANVLPYLAEPFTVIAPIYSVMANRPSREGTIHWAPMPAGSAIC